MYSHTGQVVIGREAEINTAHSYSLKQMQLMCHNYQSREMHLRDDKSVACALADTNDPHTILQQYLSGSTSVLKDL